MENKQKRVALVILKYGPSLTSITCATKILLLSIYEECTCMAVNYINIIINIVFNIMLYMLGKLFHFCKTHENLCKLANLGYICYFLALTFGELEKTYVNILSGIYLMVVIGYTLNFKKCFGDC